MKRTLLVLALLTVLPILDAQERPGRRAPGERPRRRLPEGVRLVEDLVYGRGGDRDLHLDLYLPIRRAGPVPVVVWIHGGGWRSGSKKRGRAVRLVSRGYAVASVEYRLSGEATFPAQAHDVKAAVRWLRANAEEFGLDFRHIGAWGTSAGGHLAALLGTSGGVEELSGSGGNPEQSSRVQAVCDWYGPSDLVRLGEHPGHRAEGNPVAALLGGPVAENLEAARLGSPVTHVSPDDPPFLIMHGDEDRTVPLEQSRVLESALRKAGVEATLHVVEGAGHGFTGSEVDRMVDEFFARHLKGEEPTALHERSFMSEAAKGPVPYLLYLPPGYEGETERRYPVVYWLHGRGGDPRGGTPFVRTIDLAIRDGKAPPMIVVLPDGEKDSMYCDAKDGTGTVETTIVGELIPRLDATLRTVASREGRCVAGFSMGGFGAAHLAFKYPDLFGAVSIVGGALHDGETLAEGRSEIFRKVFGGDPEYFEAQSPWKLVTENAERIRGRTRVRLVVGERDGLLPRSLSFHEHLEKLDIPHGLIVVRGVGHTHVRIYEETRELTAEFYSEAFE